MLFERKDSHSIDDINVHHPEMEMVEELIRGCMLRNIAHQKGYLCAYAFAEGAIDVRLV
jgi:hypothetical protein